MHGRGVSSVGHIAGGDMRSQLSILSGRVRSRAGSRLPTLPTLVAVLLMAIAGTAAEASGRRASMVIDANTGQVLHQQAADEPRYPASLTKMMTLYIVFELMEQGRLAPDTRIRVSEEAARTPPSKVGLKAGSDIALSDAIKALIVKSANDVAVAVAEHIAGSEEKFASLMTRKARQIGMAATTFRNPHGLPDSAQVTTARDMLTLALRLNEDFPRHYKLFSLRSFSYGGAIYRNHNTMLGYYEGMDGLKTGYIRASGFNIVTSVRRNGRHVVGAVFGGASASARNVYMRAVLDRAIAVASTERTRNPALVARVQRRERQVATVAPGGWEPKLVEGPRPASIPRANAAPRLRPTLAESHGPGPQPATQPADSLASSTRIEMTRVRPVLVAPRPRRATAALPAPPVAEERALPRFVARPPSSAGEVDPMPAAPQAAAIPTPSGVVLGTPPSTLQAQAERLSRGVVVAQPVGHAGKPAGSSAAGLRGVPPPLVQGAAGGGVALQVGAYASEVEAQRRLEAVRGASSALLGTAASRTEPVSTGGRQLWRARFVGLDARTAATACNELRRQKIDCLVARDQ
jgi:D-alanyl-D-alanine carboxypeptidase